MSDITALNYRVEDCVKHITMNQIKLYRMIELKKLMLKAKKMKAYFEDHSAERTIILNDMNRMSKLLHNNIIKMSPNVPDYLYPSFLKKEKKE